MSTAPRILIAQAIVARLAPLTIEAGRYLRALDLYNGELTGKQGIDDLKRALLGRVPAILIAPGASTTTYKTIDRRRAEETIRIEMVFVSQHWGSLTAQLYGTERTEEDPTTDPGVYQMLWDARRLLVDGDKLIAGQRDLAHQDDSEVIPGGQDFTVWRSLWEMRFQVVAEKTPVGPFTSVEERHFVENGDTANPDIVAITVADA